MNGKRETPMVLQAVKIAKVHPQNPKIHNDFVSILLSIWNHEDNTPQYRTQLESAAETILNEGKTAHPSLFRDDYTIVLLALFDLIFSDRPKLQSDDRYCEWVLSYMAFAWKTMASQATAMSIVNTSLQRIAESISDISESRGLVLIPRDPGVYTAALAAMTACIDRGVSKGSPINSLSKVEFLPLLIHLILDCVETVPEESPVVGAAFDLLRVIGTKCTGNDAALILPRVVSVIVKEITGKYGKPPSYKCFVSACKALGAIVPAALDDTDLKKESQEIKDVRTDEWIGVTREQFRMAFSSFAVAVRSHSQPTVLEALFDICISIMSRCSESLVSSMGIAIDSVMAILSKRDMKSHDELWSDIQSGTYYAILKQKDPLKSLFIEKLDEWVEGIPQALSSPDEKQALVVLKAVEYGMQYAKRLKVPMQMLDNRLVESLTEASTIFKAGGNSPNVAQFDPRKAVAPAGSFPVMAAPSLSAFGIASQLPRVSEIALYDLIYNSGSVDESMQRSLLSSSIDILHNSLDKSRKFGSLWIATTTLTGINRSRHQGRDIDEYLNLDMVLAETSSQLQPLVEDYLGVLMDICEQNASNLRQSSLIPIDNAEIALALYGLGQVSAYFGTEMKHALPDLVSPLIFYLGSSNTGIRQQAQKAISRIAYDCQYDNVERLLVDNSDYIIDGISLKLSTLDLSPQSAIVLSSLIKLAGPEVVPLMKDVIVTLMAILDNYHRYPVLTEGIFKVFETLVEEVVKGFEGRLELTDKSDKEKEGLHLSSIEQLIQELNYKPEKDQFAPIAGEAGSFEEYWKKKKQTGNENTAEELDTEAETEAKVMDNEEEEEDKKWPSIVPKSTYTTVEKIAEYTDVYLVHDSATMRYNLAKIITTAVPVLATNEKKFLPIVSSYWPVLVSRLDDSEISVLEAVLEAIARTCEFASEFMTRRVEEVWRKLRTLLPRRKGRLPKFSIEMRKMVAALKCLEKIVTHVQLTDEVYGSMLEAVVGYFSPQDSEEYRDLFISLRTSFEGVNSDYVWFEMMKHGMVKPATAPPTKLGLVYTTFS